MTRTARVATDPIGARGADPVARPPNEPSGARAQEHLRPSMRGWMQGWPDRRRIGSRSRDRTRAERLFVGPVGRIGGDHPQPSNKIGSFLINDHSRRTNLVAFPERTQDRSPNEPSADPRTNPSPRQTNS